jgi:hypothetical protein
LAAVNFNKMRTIIKNEDGTFWVRYCGMYVGTFATYKEAKKANGNSYG